MKRHLAALVLALMPTAAFAQASLPTWMAGEWIERSGDSWTEEFWLVGGDVRMLGTSRAGTGDRLNSREMLLIETVGEVDLVLIAQPRDARPVPFRMVSQGAGSIEFANPDHDYPQRIRYWREGERLNAEISLLDGSRAVSWSYEPAAR